MKTILLTGGTGFIGSHTAVELLEQGYEVVIADDLRNSRRETVDAMEKITGRRAIFYEADVQDRVAMEKIFSQQKVDAVIHLAGLKSVGESVRFPLTYYRNNIDATLTLLEVMKEHGCHCLIFSSSAAVYGGANPVPYQENMPMGECTNPYGWSKQMIEIILRSAAEADSQLRVICLRYFNPVGAHKSGLIGELPRGIPNNLMPYITQTAAGIREKLHIFGNDYPTPDGTGVRDYIHVTDLARGHVAALSYGEEHPGWEAINLGTGHGTSVLELVHTFEKVNGVPLPYDFAPRRAGDLAVCYAATEKAQRLLGWQAQLTVEDMVKDAWRWQQNCKE